MSSAWEGTADVEWWLRTEPLGATASSEETQLNGFGGPRGYSWNSMLSRYSGVYDVDMCASPGRGRRF